PVIPQPEKVVAKQEHPEAERLEPAAPVPPPVARIPTPIARVPAPAAPVPAPAVPPRVPVVPVPPPAASNDLESVAVGLSKRFEDQLAYLRQEREALKHRVQQLERGKPGVAGDKETAKAGTEGLHLRTQLDAAKEAAALAEAMLKEEVERREALEEQLKNSG